jgi:hypothetical protein
MRQLEKVPQGCPTRPSAGVAGCFFPPGGPAYLTSNIVGGLGVLAVLTLGVRVLNPTFVMGIPSPSQVPLMDREAPRKGLPPVEPSGASS